MNTLAAWINALFRLAFGLLAALFVLGLLALGVVVFLVLWLVSRLTGRRAPVLRTWTSQARHQWQRAQPGRRAPPAEVVDVEVKELR